MTADLTIHRMKIGAVIPTQQFGNLQPEFEVTGATYAEMVDLALSRIKEIWDRTAEEPLTIDRGTAPVMSAHVQVLRCAVSGTELLFDPILHTYHDRDGNKYLGGSTFASRYKTPFASEIIAKKMALKNEVAAEDILAMWALNANASSTFGTSVHVALQLYGEYLELSKKVKNGSDESALTSNPVLRPIVKEFFTEERRQEKAFYEILVANPAERASGLIDRLVAEEDGVFIEDFKTNSDVSKAETVLPPFKGVVPSNSLGIYWLQLSYYARCLMAHGRVVKGLRIHHWTGTEWKLYEHEVVNLDAAFQGL